MYVDDSGNPCMTAGAGSYDVLSGIIIHESHLKYIENKVIEYKAKSFVREFIAGYPSSITVDH
jgi:hypothetical protein